MSARKQNKSVVKRSCSHRFIGKPNGVVSDRVQKCGPDRFGVVTVDCAKRRSKWMLCNFYGKVLVEPTSVEHDAAHLTGMIQSIRAAIRRHHLAENIVAVEMTGIYHKPVVAACRQAGLEVRIVHPFASSHYRRVAHPDLKTDDHDLEAIFLAAINGFGLTAQPVDPVYLSLQSLSRHRHNLVKQRSRLMVQMRRLIHMTMPGYADLWEVDKFFHKSIAIEVAIRFPSATKILAAGVGGIAQALAHDKLRFQDRTIEKIVAWAATAADPAELADMRTRQWQQYNQMRLVIGKQIEEAEREMAGFLVKTPYILLLSVCGINVVSASRLAGEAGPIERYASARAINGRAGLYPSRYQSDEVDFRNGPLVRQCNRKLRGAAMLVAENLIKCHPYYRNLSELWKAKSVDPRERRCRVANRAMRMVWQIVAGRHVWRGKGVDREYLLDKLRQFHLDHYSPLEQTIADLHEAFNWLPRHTWDDEARPLLEVSRKRTRKVQSIGELLIPLLIRLGVGLEEKNHENHERQNTGGDAPERVELTTSEARSSD